MTFCTLISTGPEPVGSGWVCRCSCGWTSSNHPDPKLPFLAFENHEMGNTDELRGLAEFEALQEVVRDRSTQPTDRQAQHRAQDFQDALAAYNLAVAPPL